VSVFVNPLVIVIDFDVICEREKDRNHHIITGIL